MNNRARGVVHLSPGEPSVQQHQVFQAFPRSCNSIETQPSKAQASGAGSGPSLSPTMNLNKAQVQVRSQAFCVAQHAQGVGVQSIASIEL